MFPHRAPALTLVLCDSCAVDFGSIDASYFGLPKGTAIGYGYMSAIDHIDAAAKTLDKDHFCPDCHRRHAYLQFVSTARESFLNKDEP